jgi:hypothetical protein
MVQINFEAILMPYLSRLLNVIIISFIKYLLMLLLHITPDFFCSYDCNQKSKRSFVRSEDMKSIVFSKHDYVLDLRS